MKSAIYGYIENARPKSEDTEQIFLNERGYGGAMSSKSVSDAVRSAFKNSKIDILTERVVRIPSVQI